MNMRWPRGATSDARRIDGSADGGGHHAGPGRAIWSDDVEPALRRTRVLADLLDQHFRIPGTGIRFGYDAIIGLIPVIGDTATALIGLYPVFEARRLGLGKRIIARMLANLGIDWLIGLVPLIDVVLDVAYKANLKNARLLEQALRKQRLGG
jgi:hypothetical protein